MNLRMNLIITSAAQIYTFNKSYVNFLDLIFFSELIVSKKNLNSSNALDFG